MPRIRICSLYHRFWTMNPERRLLGQSAYAIYAILLIFIIVYYIGFRQTNVTIVNEPQHETHIRPDGFLVWNKLCTIPEVNPFTTKKRSQLDSSKAFNGKCASARERDTPLVTKLYDKITQTYYLHINRQWEPLYLNDSSKQVNCCYMEIIRVDENSSTDAQYELLPCFHFDQDFEVHEDTDGVIVQCVAWPHVGATSTHIFADAFTFVQKRARYGKVNLNTKFGILLLGIGGLSQMGLRRWLPQTYEFLNTDRESWYEFSGYNQHGDDTFVSLTTLLSGLQPEEMSPACNPHLLESLNKCPYLWKQAHKLGLVTVHVEDVGATQHIVIPTDYSLHTFMSAVEERLKSTQPFARRDCRGSRFASDYVYDYALEFAKRLEGRGSFGVFWLSTVQEHFDSPAHTDERLMRFLLELETKSLLESYVVLLLSDGVLQTDDDLYDTSSGFYEQRMPMFFMSLPDTLRREHPEFAYALTLNKHRLVSPLDVHVTLHHLLALARGHDWNYTRASSCPACRSLLQPFKIDRGCTEAAIDWFGCSCEPFETKSTTAIGMQNMKKLLVNRLNELLEGQGLLQSNTCQKFQPPKIKILNVYFKRKNPSYHYVKMSTTQSVVVFKLAFWFIEKDEVLVLDGTKVMRANGAANVACLSNMEGSIAKKLCICKE